MNKRSLLAAAVALGLAFCASYASAAELVPVNFDGPDEGYNDPTPATPVGGNPGTTIGAQRLNAFTFAANIWGATLTSAVPIIINAQFSALACSV